MPVNVVWLLIAEECLSNLYSLRNELSFAKSRRLSLIKLLLKLPRYNRIMY